MFWHTECWIGERCTVHSTSTSALPQINSMFSIKLLRPTDTLWSFICYVHRMLTNKWNFRLFYLILFEPFEQFCADLLMLKHSASEFKLLTFRNQLRLQHNTFFFLLALFSWLCREVSDEILIEIRSTFIFICKFLHRKRRAEIKWNVFQACW